VTEDTHNVKKSLAPSSRFEFVVVASARAKQLLQGCTPRVEGDINEVKPARIAQREVEAGEVSKQLADPK
jgi:DNA-directed RNA polymerase omega subunit